MTVREQSSHTSDPNELSAISDADDVALRATEEAAAAVERQTSGQPYADGDDAAFEQLIEQAATTPHSVRLPAIGEVIAGRYRVEQQLGAGGMGAVFRATHVVSEKQVAIKWMLRPASDEHARRRFVREARAAAKIEHPNVVDVYDAGQHGAEVGLYLVMPLLRGEALRDRLARGRMAIGELVDLLVPAMRGVSAVHEAGIIHRDLKPENIFLCEGRGAEKVVAKVLDFGISASGIREPDATLTNEGAVLGTPAYMSPEQLRNPRAVDVRTDVYAFGVILYEALAGERPFKAESYHGLVLAVVNDPPRKLRELCPDVPRAAEAVVMRALAKQREDRFDDMEALVQALLPFGSAPSTGSGRTSLPPASARKSGWLAIGAVGIAGLLGLGWFASTGAPERSVPSESTSAIQAAPQAAPKLPAEAPSKEEPSAAAPVELAPVPAASPADAGAGAVRPRTVPRKPAATRQEPALAAPPTPPPVAQPAPAQRTNNARSGRITSDDL